MNILQVKHGSVDDARRRFEAVAEEVSNADEHDGDADDDESEADDESDDYKDDDPAEDGDANPDDDEFDDDKIQYDDDDWITDESCSESDRDAVSAACSAIRNRRMFKASRNPCRLCADLRVVLSHLLGLD